MVEESWLPYNVKIRRKTTVDTPPFCTVPHYSLICDEAHYIKGRILTEKNIDKRHYD
jgi:hypothetical protein